MELTELLHTSDQKLIDEITEASALEEFEENQLVIDIGQKLPGMPLVLDGLLRVYRVVDDQEYFLYHIQKGEVCAMAIQCCLSHKKSDIRIYADRPSRVLFIPAEQGAEWMSQYPEWSIFMLRSISDKFAKLTYSIDGLAFETLETRLVDYLQEKAEVLGTMALPVTHTQMARDLNSSREVISRTLKKLQNKGLIRKDRGLVVLAS